jgi:starch phosphorylase
MAHLAIHGSHHVNGVAAIHTDILKKTVFKDFYELEPDKFINVTNGVTQRRWLLHCNPLLSDFITQRIGDGWITDFSQIKNIANYAGDPVSQQEFLQIKRENKQRLIDFLQRENRQKDYNGQVIKHSSSIDVDSLFDVQIKRIHEYKRQLMSALHLIMIYQELLENAQAREVKRTAIFAGKAAPGYEVAKDIIRLIHCIARKVNDDPAIEGALKIVLVENYNVSRAEMIIPAADLSEQISTAGTEASGTGNMKLTINGALTIGTDDGANIEMRQQIHDQWWPFLFGCSSEEIHEMKKTKNYSPWDIYGANAKISNALNTLRDKVFAFYESEHQIFSNIYYSLLEGQFGEPPDKYFILKDLESYANTQRLVEQLYKDPAKWAEYAIHNIAGMWKFSSDEAVKQYAKEIWQIQPSPIDDKILEQVRGEYSEHDKCRILLHAK